MKTEQRSRRQSLAGWILGLLSISSARSALGQPAAPAAPAPRTVPELLRLNPATLSPAQHVAIQVGGYWQFGDGGGGVFRWEPDNRSEPDGMLVFAPGAAKPGTTPPPGRWVRRVETGVFTFEMAGARGDGKTDDWERCQIASDAISRRYPGGTIRLRPGRQYLIERADLVVRPGLMIEGSGGSLGQVSKDLPTFLDAGSGFWLDPARSVKLGFSAGLRDLWVMRRDIRDSLVPTAEELGKQLAQWESETSVGVRGEGDSFQVIRCTIIGFHTALLATTGRFIIDDIHFDCINGIEITRAGDIGRVRGAHAVPYYAVHLSPDLLGGKTWYRSGIGYNIHDKADGVSLSDCFCLCYRVGFRLSNVWAVVLDGPTVDGNGHLALTENTVGLLVENCASFCQVLNPKLSAVGRAMVLNQTDAPHATEKPAPGTFPKGFLTVRGGFAGTVLRGKVPIVNLGPYSRGIVSNVLIGSGGTQPIGVGENVYGWLLEDLTFWTNTPHEWISLPSSSRNAIKMSGIVNMDTTPPTWLVPRT